MTYKTISSVESELQLLQEIILILQYHGGLLIQLGHHILTGTIHSRLRSDSKILPDDMNANAGSAANRAELSNYTFSKIRRV